MQSNNSKALRDFIASCGSSEEYLIGIYEKKYTEKVSWAQGVAVDSIAYFAATNQWEKVRNLIQQKNREARERMAPPPVPDSQREIKD